jgi:hypothetical protein
VVLVPVSSLATETASGVTGAGVVGTSSSIDVLLQNDPLSDEILRDRFLLDSNVKPGMDDAIRCKRCTTPLKARVTGPVRFHFLAVT